MKAIDILNYRNQFKDGDNYTDIVYFNDSILHATIIMTELFKKASSEEDKTVRMYCGKLSLLRDNTKDIISNAKMSCELDGLPTEKEEEWRAFKPWEELKNEVSQYLSDESKGNLWLIIEHGFESLKKCTIWKDLKRGIENGRVKMFLLRDKIGIGHFAVTEEAYRLEDSDDNKTASGCFRDTENANILNDNFDFLQTISEPVCL